MTEPTTLQSGIMRSYPGRFVVDEDSLRRLQAALAKGGTSLPFETHVVFHVDREDDRFYETTDLTNVLSDANLPGRRVRALSIELRRVDSTPADRPWLEPWVVQVTFAATSRHGNYRHFSRMFDEPAELTVITSDRNWALLMADELEPQVQRVLAKSRISWLTYPAVVAALLVISVMGEVLKAQGTSALLQPYTIWRIAAAVPLGIIVAWMLRTAPFRILFPGGFTGWFGRESVFLWGEELKQYPQRQRFRRNLVWSVVVAFLVSLLASLLAWVLTSRGPQP